MPKRRTAKPPPLPGLEDERTLPDGSKVIVGSVLREMWRTGYGLELLLLNEVQFRMEEMRRSLPRHARMFVEASRKIGKTRWALVAILLKNLRQMKAVCRLAAETKSQALEILKPQFDELLETCPEEYRPHYTEGEYYWPHTGSRLFLAGTDRDDQIRRLRGPKSDLTVVDEIGAHECDLHRLINTILAPQCLDTGGNIIMTGTPPESLDHASMDFRGDAASKGRLLRFTIWDNPRLSKEDIRQICTEANMGRSAAEIDAILAGKLEGSAAWEREYMIRQISDRSLRVTPNFRSDSKDCRGDEIVHVGTCSMPTYADKYVFIDPGHARDFFAAVFGFIDYGAQRFVVQREYTSLRKPTDEIVSDLRAIEAEVWPYGKMPGENLRRIAEPSNVQQIEDFCHKNYQVEVGNRGFGKEQIVAELVNRLQMRAPDGGPVVAIDPRCKNLIACMENGIFDSKRADGGARKFLDFRRTPALGHLDTLDALATGMWHLNWTHNPAPMGTYNSATQFLLGPTVKPASPLVSALAGLYGKRAVVARA